VSAPDGPHARIYRDIAEKVWQQLSGAAVAGRAAPAIVFE
jgi:ATP-binding protein involved in chromosome partitioning